MDLRIPVECGRLPSAALLHYDHRFHIVVIVVWSWLCLRLRENQVRVIIALE